MNQNENGRRHLGSLHIMYHEEPGQNGGRFVQVRQWLTADGEHSDLVVEHGSVKGGDLATESTVVPFYSTVEEALLLLATIPANVPALAKVDAEFAPAMANTSTSS